MFFELMQLLSSKTITDGSEVEIIKVLSKKYNFAITRVVPQPAWGKPLTSKSYYAFYTTFGLKYILV